MDRRILNQSAGKESKPSQASARAACAGKPASHHGAAKSPCASPGARIRVLVADDHPVVRKGLALCLSSQPEFELVGEARDGKEALDLARQLAPDVVLMDLNMPRLSGLAATESLQKELPRTKVLLLSTHNTAECVLRVLRSGARGYVLKEAPAEEIVQAIQRVQGGEVYFSPRVAHVAMNHFVRRSSGTGAPELSNRERDILTGIAEGLSNKEIACRLDIGTRTVETHRERLMRKLNIHSVAGLTKFAILNGMIPFPEMVLAEVAA
ncbi:MAG TPA: response regulator transcription factor [Verrucomicrobiota bacterium]|nr:response regulator transcription factor [Verrucomicrobiota bacterium]HRT06835.1 response regulator transcription factor [Candidatus Paceibacterota bacterium]HRT55694.1 response regulator transcription factor [Candidatus Paceibacterota bacterium]